MNDINEMPPKCQYCPYWEVCEYPWVCPDREQLATNLQQTCSATDTISRQAAIDAVKKNTFRLTFAEEQNCEGHLAWSANAVYSDVIEGALLELPSAQPKSYREGYQAGFKDAQPEIIRCGECKHWREDHTCREHSLVSPMMAYEFCSRAERREE